MCSCEDKYTYEDTACSETTPIKTHMKKNGTEEDLQENTECNSFVCK